MPSTEAITPTGRFERWFRGFIQGKTRIAAAWIFVLVLGFFSREFPTWPGIALCFVGASLRFWASGYLRKDQRPAVGGPYALVRNPLYLGTYLMAVGTVWAAGNLPLLAAVTLLFAGVYHFIILDEETKLRGLFGEPYRLYCDAVPRFVPRPWPTSQPALDAINPERAHRVYSWELAMRNKAYEAFASFGGLIALVALCAWVWKRVSAS